MVSKDTRIRLAVGGALLVYVALSITWAFYIPLGGGIDEPRHLRYVQIVAEEGRLPTPAEKGEAISHHPPLHYVLVTPVYLATQGLGEAGAWRALRLAQVPIGAATLVVMFAMLRRMIPDRPWLAVAGMAAVALLPHYQLISAVLSNDITTALFSTVMLYFVVRGIRNPERILRWALLAGLAGGLAALTRTNAIAMIPPALAAIVVGPFLRRNPKPPPEAEDERADDSAHAGSLALRGAVAFGGVFTLTGGLWLTRHIAIWGGIDPDPPWPEAAWPVHTFLGKFIRAASGVFRSWWAQVGWVPGPHSARPLGFSRLWPRPDLETPIFAVAAILSLLAAAGVIALLVRWLRDPRTRRRGAAVATLVTCWLLTTGGLIYNAMYVNPGRYEGGRYMMPAVAAVMGLLVIGPLALPRKWTKVVWVATLALLAAMTAISFWEMHTYLIPTFAQ